MKKIVFIIIISCFFFACNSKKENDLSDSNKDNIDTLLSRAYDFKKEEKVRLFNAEKALKILKDNPNDSLTRYYYFKLAGRYYNLEEYDKYLTVCNKVYKMAQESNDTLSIAKSLSYIGDYHYNKFKNDSAYYYYSKAEKTYQYLNSNQDVDRLRLYKANILFFEKDFSGCETAIIAILKSAIQKKDNRLIYDCYITLGNSLDGLNNTAKALEYFNKAAEVTKDLTEDPQYLLLKAQTYNYIGRVYQKENEHLNAIDNFQAALEIENFKEFEPLMYANLINNLGYSKFKLGQKTALGFLYEAYTIRQDLNNTLGILSSKISLSEYYLQQNDSAKALQYSQDAVQIAHVNRIFEDELKSLKLLAKINPKEESFYNNRFIKLTDSLQNNERAIRNKFARIEFETEEILDQKNDIEAEKNKISLQRWTILGSSLIVILIIALSYITKVQHSKNKELKFEQEQQKANEEIYQLMLHQQAKIEEGRQNEKKRIAQELHDGIMSKLTSTRLNLFILSKKTDEETIKKCLGHIAEMQNIEKEIRAISHDLNKDIFSGKDSFKTIIEALFEGQNSISEADYHLEIDDSINWDAVESTTKMHLYRIFQESLQNIHKYAKAKNVYANINKQENDIYIEIKDDGVGFDTKKTKEGIGLKNMQSRMKTINGKINVQSVIKKGTIINIIIPT
ncbi:ATP-binding protein [Flavobacterium sp.]|uniref:tetratricopeptide repeat-containing sensor histidine kinase n=1 Tax=Flavobacterium sp. TaxID=239 RepID=UPI00260D8580|nr:ATP-binding protein [Flavobacterium sp.]